MKTTKGLFRIFTIVICFLIISCDNGNDHNNDVPLVANAGTDQNRTLANDLIIILNGTESTGSITAYTWECVSYIANKGNVNNLYTNEVVTALIINSDKETATVSVRKAGTYVFKLTVLDNNNNTDAKNVTVTVNSLQVTNNVNVAEVPFTPGSELILKLDVDNYYFTTGNGDYFNESDLNEITYKLFQTNLIIGNNIPPTPLDKDLSPYDNGNIPYTEYKSGDYPTITQAYYYREQIVGNRKIVVERSPMRFETLHTYNPTEFSGVWYDTDWEVIYAIASITLNLKKEITELD